MELNKHILNEKKFIKLLEEFYKIKKEIAKIPSIAINPYQKGWIITYDLREDYINRKDANILKLVLNLTNIKYETKNVKLIKIVRKFKSFREIISFNENNKINNFIPGLRNISINKFNSLSDKEKEYFYKDISTITQKVIGYKPVISNYLLQLKVLPNIITHQKAINPELESKLKFINKQLNYLDNRGYGSWRNYGKSYPESNLRIITKSKIKQFLKNPTDDLDITIKTKKIYVY